MKTKRKLSRYALARRLHYLALQISAGKPLRIGTRSIQVPEHVIVEEELEMAPGEVDLEIEVHWPSRAARISPLKAAPAPRNRRVVRRLP